MVGIEVVKVFSMAEDVFVKDNTKDAIVITLEEVNDTELVEEQVAGGLVYHYVDYCSPAVEGKAMCKGGVEKINYAQIRWRATL